MMSGAPAASSPLAAAARKLFHAISNAVRSIAYPSGLVARTT
jgi:hypothetical protein